MQTATLMRKPRSRAFDRGNEWVHVSVGNDVKTAWGKGRVETILGDAIYVRINDPGKAEHGKRVCVRSLR